AGSTTRLSDRPMGNRDQRRPSGYSAGPAPCGAGVLSAGLDDFAARAGGDGFERLSGFVRRSSTSPTTGEITTERRPAATSPAALAWLTTPSWSPIWVAATMTVSEVA